MGGYEGEGNIDVDPLFRDPENGDFHLMATYCGDSVDSPCIDMGSPFILDSLLDCSWGLGTSRSDMGAFCGGDSTQVEVPENNNRLPNRFQLFQSYPNPFNDHTIIPFNLPANSEISLNIYNLAGQLVETLVDGPIPAGHHSATWNASGYSSGIYFYKLQAGDFVQAKKMNLIK
jgi:hypothetical protein